MSSYTSTKNVNEEEVTKPLLSTKNNRAQPRRPKKARILCATLLLCTALLYTAAPALPSIAKIIKYAATGQANKIKDVVRLELYRDLIANTDQFTFTEYLPSPLSEAETVQTLWREFEDFRSSHELPVYREVYEETKIDPKSNWNFMILRVHGINTCYADYFQESLKLIDASGWDARSISLSAMQPGHVIPEHNGPNNIFWRHLMMLKVPEEPTSYLKVWPSEEDSTPIMKNWTKPGDEFVFDDTWLHMAENPTSEERVGLFLDAKRKDMKGWRENLINNVMMKVMYWAPFEQKIKIFDGTNRACEAIRDQ